MTTSLEPCGKYPRFPHPYWTQCEVEFGLLLSIRLGVNIGESLDFILGWTTLDIFDDDIEWKNRASGTPDLPGGKEEDRLPESAARW